MRVITIILFSACILANLSVPVAIAIDTDGATRPAGDWSALSGQKTTPGYYVYAKPDDRPELSPLGDFWPHPTGVPDGYVPEPIAQTLATQFDAVHALPDAWTDGSGQSQGNDVIAFFNVQLDGDGNYQFWPHEVWGPYPDNVGHDFLAHTNGAGHFDFPYDATATASEYFGGPGVEPPDPASLALNAKITQAFYAVNWLNDFFYRAGFDETAGNAQASNHGRGGIDGDPLVVHAGAESTASYIAPEGESPVLALGRNRSSTTNRDATMDFTVIAHEWGHYMIARLAGGTGFNDMRGMDNHQGRALHEGIADFIALLTGIDPDDDLSKSYAEGAYFNLDYQDPTPETSFGAEPDAMYYGTRRYPYSTSFNINPLTLRHLVEPVPDDPLPFDWKDRAQDLSNIHSAGEIFAQALFQCFAEIIERRDGDDFEQIRLDMARYLVGGLMLFPDQPDFVEARNALFLAMNAENRDDYEACRSGFALRGMGADAVAPPREETTFSHVEESFLDADALPELTQPEPEPEPEPGHGGGGALTNLLWLLIPAAFRVFTKKRERYQRRDE